MAIVNPTTYICFDLETTGLDPARDHILEIGAVKLDSQGNVNDRFEMLACPAGAIPAAATRIHGIDAKMVRGCPPPAHVARAFMNWVPPGALLIAHNAPYDAAFLLSAHGGGKQLKQTRVLDTLEWSRNQLPQLGNHKLATLADYFGIDGKTDHRATSDALTVGKLFCHLHRLSVSPSEAIQAYSKPVVDSAKLYSLSPARFAGRKLQGWATEKQLDFLAALGATERQMENLSKQQASELIDQFLGRKNVPATSRGIGVGGCFLSIFAFTFLLIVLASGESSAPRAPSPTPMSKPVDTRPDISPAIDVAPTNEVPLAVGSHRIEDISLFDGMTLEEAITELGPVYREISKIEAPGRPTYTTMEWTFPDDRKMRVRFEGDWVESWEVR